MSDISTELKQWGSTGELWPDGYSQVDGEAPVDAWHNKLFSETIINIKDDIIPTINGRAESYVGTTAPSSPESGHKFVDTDDVTVSHYINGGWNKVAWHTDLQNHTSDSNNPHGVDASDLGALLDTGDTTTGNIVYDDSGAVFQNNGGGNLLEFQDASGGSITEHSIEVIDVPLSVTGTDTSAGTSNTVLTVDPVGVDVDIPDGTLNEKGNRVATRTWTDNQLSGKSDTGHDHDGRYYTETEVDNQISSHNHDDLYYTETEVDGMFGNFTFTDNYLQNGGNIIEGGQSDIIVNPSNDFSGFFISSTMTVEATSSHIDIEEYIDSSTSKIWRIQSTGSDFRIDEVGSGARLIANEGGGITIPNDLTVNGDYVEVPVHTSTLSSAPSGAMYAVE